MSALLLVLAITGAQPATATHVETITEAVAVSLQQPAGPDLDVPLSSGSGHQPLSYAETLPVSHHQDGGLLERIIQCESDGVPTAQNPVSSASGIYQFIDSTWRYVWADYLGEPAPTARAFQASVADQHRAGRALFDREGSTPWNASEGCWS